MARVRAGHKLIPGEGDDMDWEPFLRAVLPHSEPMTYCIGRGATPNGETFYDSLDEVVAAANNSHARENHTNEWLAICGLVHGSRKRSGRTFQAARSFVLDIDIKPSPTHYNSKDEALAALSNAITSGALPVPTAVLDSGGGYHVYWAINRDMPPGEYSARSHVFADRLRAVDPRLSADLSVTKNVVGYARLPGSQNHKYTPAPRVEAVVLNIGLTYDAEAIAPTATGAQVQSMPRMSQQVPGMGPDQARVIKDKAHILSTGIDMFAGCAVLRHISENQHHPEHHPEHLNYEPWRDMMALLSYTSDFKQIAHAVSSMSPKYDAAKTDRQIDIELDNQNKPEAGPITCETLCSKLPAHIGRSKCQGCPFFAVGKGTPYRAAADVEAKRVAREHAAAIGKPEGLGSVPNLAPERAPDAAAGNITVAPAAAPAGGVAVEGVPFDPKLFVAPAEDGAPPMLRQAEEDDETVVGKKRILRAVGAKQPVLLSHLGLKLDTSLIDGHEEVKIDQSNGSMYIMVPSDPNDTANSPLERANLCSRMFWPVQYVRQENSGELDVRIAIAGVENGNWVAVMHDVKASDLSPTPDKLVSALSRFGVHVPYNIGRRRYLMDWFINRMSNMHITDAVDNLTHFGWNTTTSGEDSFVVGRFAFTASGLQVANLSDALTNLNERTFPLRGTVETAKACMKYIADHGIDEMKYAMMMAAGAPMMFRTAQKGLYVNLFGENGKGKSLIGCVVAGLWGSAEKNAMHISSKDTLNSRYATMSALHSLPVVHDEATTLHQTASMPNPEIGQYLYDVSEGRGKGRALKTGGNADVTNWETIVFATSNACIREQMSVGNEAMAAQVARAYEINIDRPVLKGAMSDQAMNMTLTALGKSLASCSGVMGLVLGSHYGRNRQRMINLADSMDAHVTGILKGVTAETRTRRAALTAALVGANVLYEAGLWDITPQQAEVIALSVDAAVHGGNSARAVDPKQVVSQILSSMDGHTATMKHLPTSHVRFMTKGGNPGVAPYALPRNDLRARFDFVVGDKYGIYTIKRDALQEAMRRRGLDMQFVLKALKRAGLQVMEHTTDIHNGVPAMSRDNIASTSTMPPVPVVSFVFAVDPRNWQDGEAPVVLHQI